MSKYNEGYNPDKCPENIPSPVWVAFCKWVHTPHADKPDRWKAFTEVHQLYYERLENGECKRRAVPLAPTLF